MFVLLFLAFFFLMFDILDIMGNDKEKWDYSDDIFDNFSSNTVPEVGLVTIFLVLATV